VSATTTLSDVLAFISSASSTDLPVLSRACTQRGKALHEERGAALRDGDEVELRDLSPAYLNGLTGTVSPGSILRGRFALALDQRSTSLLRWKGRSKYFIAADASTHLLSGIPVGCAEKRPVAAGS
jgi:hypothetical protein